MKLHFAENVDQNAWDEKLCSMGGTIFHSSIWADYIVHTNHNVVPQFITLLSENEEILGLALGFHESSRHRLIGRFTRKLWLDAAPQVQNDDEEKLYEFIRLLVSAGKRNKNVTISIGSYASHTSINELEMLGFNLINRIEFILQVDCSEDIIWKGLKDKKRNTIRKALKMEITIEELPGEQGVFHLFNLKAESARRIVERGGPDLTLKDKYRVDPNRILANSGFGRIIGAKIDGKIVSAALFTFFNEMVYYTQSGSNQMGLKKQAPTLILWESIKKFKKEGAKIFNLGGCKASAVDRSSPENGLYVFKKGFGGTIKKCVSGEKILNTVFYELNRIQRIILRK